MIPGAQVRAFADELAKMAGLPRPPAIAGSATTNLLSGATKPLLSGGTNTATNLAKTVSPAALVPPPPISV